MIGVLDRILLLITKANCKPISFSILVLIYSIAEFGHVQVAFLELGQEKIELIIISILITPNSETPDDFHSQFPKY